MTYNAVEISDHRYRKELADRARRLFEFLAQAQKVRTKPVTSWENYRKQEPGDVFLLYDLPEHPAVARTDETEDSDDLVLSLGRTNPISPPAPPTAEWLIGEWSKPDDRPRISPDLTAETDGDPTWLRNRQRIRAALEKWLADWKKWAAEESQRQKAQDLYERSFRIHTTMDTLSDTHEFVLGVGLLTWWVGGELISRHVLTTQVETRMDDRTGRIDFILAGHGLREELDMLSPENRPSHEVVHALHEDLQSFTGSPLDPDAVRSLTEPLVHRLDSSGKYLDTDRPPAQTASPTISFSPMVILRKRSDKGIEKILQDIAHVIDSTGEVPAGLLSLVDPDAAPPPKPMDKDGGLVNLDGEIFAALPLNSVQERILEQVNSRAQILVQGPPGTGKTHTAAALLSHLLAQGQRVLVTAQTDRALHEVRGKLPEAVRSLAVAVVGTSRSDMADLKLAVNEIASRHEYYDPVRSQEKIARLLRTIEEFRVERKGLGQQLLNNRLSDTEEREHSGYYGTLAHLARVQQEERAHFGWITEFNPPSAPCPVSDDAALDWLRALRDDQYASDVVEAVYQLPPEVVHLPTPDDFTGLIERAVVARNLAEQYHARSGDQSVNAALQLSAEKRTNLRDRMERITRSLGHLSHLRSDWTAEALADMLGGAGRIWAERRNLISQQIHQARQHAFHVPPGTNIEIFSGGDELLPAADALLSHVTAHGPVKTTPDGQPKMGMFTPAAVKQAAPIFQQVLVNGRPPTTQLALVVLLAHLNARRLVQAADLAWPPQARAPYEQNLQERITWHLAQLDQLNQLLQLGQDIDETNAWFEAQRLPRPDWSNPSSVQVLRDALVAAEMLQNQHLAEQPVVQLREALRIAVRNEPTIQVRQMLLDAVEAEDPRAYAIAHRRIQYLLDVRESSTRLREAEQVLSESVPGLVSAVQQDPHDPVWDVRLGELSRAWAWHGLTVEITTQMAAPSDDNEIHQRIQRIEDKIRDLVADLAAERAWAHAVGPDRLSGKNRQYLIQYSQLVSRLGKGTGKYADRRRAEIRQTMDLCRPLVPVWIMPLYRIAEQLAVTENMFDVVLVDEASQAGVEAMFLQYLAPRIIVIGDDKQVSPSAVGVDEEKIRGLADQYFDRCDPAKPVWQDPKRSLFDEARARFHGQLTLVEHRRCVPEIIGFSNLIAYEPDGIHLVPIRQTDLDGLPPIQTIYCPDGVESGTSTKINRAEAAALVDQLLECLTDPAYDGKTFGIISLRGSAQARYIEGLLIQQVPPEEWSKRDLRCGDSASFQGSERDVMFLSMVTAPPDGSYVRGSRTTAADVQRFNVAFSRAKDQVWLFHSVRLQQLRHEEDVRHQLLAYCLRHSRNSAHSAFQPPALAGAIPPFSSTATGTSDLKLPALVSETERERGFDSLFEQRVFNRIVTRGYLVRSQVEANGYRIDLVVTGGKARLAVECDGDAWHGPEQYQRDLARQRELERCGWHFFRVRETNFYVDPQLALAPLWQMLDTMGISPIQPEEPAQAPSAPTPARASAEELVPFSLPIVTDPPSESEDATAGPRRAWPDAEPGADQPRQSETEKCPEANLAIDDLIGVDTPSLPPALPYRLFKGTVPSLINPVDHETRAALRAIVEAEGPVTGGRLKRVFFQAAGTQPAQLERAKLLNQAIRSALCAEAIQSDDPLEESHLNALTYFVQGQSYAPRVLGPRRLDEVPPTELAALLDLVDDGSDVTTVYERALQHIQAGPLDLAAWESFNRVDRLRVNQPEPRVNLEADFDSAVRDACAMAKAELNYDPVSVLNAVEEHGALEAARRFARSPRESQVFCSLMERNRADLTVEHLMTIPRFRQLFSRSDIERATARLKGYRHSP